MTDLLFLYSAAAALVLYFLTRILFKPNRTPLPPGPKPLPFVGNVADLPPKDIPEWKHWIQHKSLYGPISSVTVLGQTLIILNDKQAALELLEKRAAKHSNRPYMEFAFGMCGFEKLTASQQNDNTLRSLRKLIHNQMGSTASLAKFDAVQETEVGRFLLRTLNKPENLVSHIQTEAGAIILNLTYGYSLEPMKRDPLVILAERMMQNFSLATSAGAWPVDFLPALKLLPETWPGAGFKKTAREWKQINDDLADRPYDFVKDQIARGANRPSFVANMIHDSQNRDGEVSTEDEFLIKWASASMYSGGADTSVSSMMAFFLAMTMYPEAQRKAKEEIDLVVGPNRVPLMKDRGKLPYVNAMVKESLRWQPVVPMGLPHATAEDDIYKGYLIPKNALLLPNVWWFAHDPEVYHDPESFKPERFLEPHNEPSPDFGFGFGRRVCPGKKLADASIFLTIAQSLAVFDIERMVDEKGVEIPTRLESTAGIITHPKPWAYKITPRSEKHAELIRKVEVDHPWVESDARQLSKMDKYVV